MLQRRAPAQQIMERFRSFVVTSTPLYNPGDTSKIVDDGLRSAEEPHFSTITTQKWTFLYSTKNSPAHLYDKEHDPKESQNIIDQNWEVMKICT